MLNKYFSFYKVCREKNKLYNYIKSVFVEKIEQIEDSLIYSNDLPYAVLSLENSRFINPNIGQKLANTAKLVFHNNDLSKLKSAQFAVEILNSLYQYADKSDAELYKEIYKFYQNHPYLFDKNLITRLQYYYHQLAENAHFEDLVEIGRSVGSITNTRMFTPVVLDLYNIKRQSYWNLIVRYDPDKLTSTATLTHKSGITIRMQGVYPNNYEDITDTKQMIAEKRFDAVILNSAPVSIAQIDENKKFDIINKITSNLEANRIFKDKVEQVLVTDFEPIIEELKKNFRIDNSKQILTGVQQGFEVPYTLESLIYQFSTQKKESNQPHLILGGLGIEDKLRLFLNQINPQKITNELQTLRFKWLNQVFSHVAKAQKIGCFVCGTQPEAINPPSKILNENPIILNFQSKFLADITLKYIGNSTKKDILLILNQSIFYDTLKHIVEAEIIKNDFSIDEYRSNLIKQKLGVSPLNQNYLNLFKQFYEDSLETNQIYKLCSQEILDLNKISKLKYIPGQQIRCGIRDILF
ncbi:unnamed protein product (macronuclear) [Paramecium tetraurelia]|uniref:Uncharacterized protein n=1 Tax=Paramecium tetraurelia TaxID=5888 RepID=A0DPG1_PARTE|nr:uncharacterized protein GSPATT00019110001 [Paramecium tetraurelia]CAK84928.1 unnamed protein product [Paramecium tetraurelia]|eukprot:XP_001452325.1 hypothetical protein (macronuclear) [Paramecium tetraurelia strain d4-2]